MAHSKLSQLSRINGLKPFVPQAIRTEARRKLAGRLRDRLGDVWPIMPASERPPSNWQGGRESEKFAFVLTHYVESSAGLANCRSLRSWRWSLGFAPRFNFVPEGNYRVPDELTARV